jgi:hypothetical protein
MDFFANSAAASDLKRMATRFGVVCTGAPARAPFDNGQHIPGSMGLIYETWRFCMVLSVPQSAWVFDEDCWLLSSPNAAAEADLQNRIDAALSAGFDQARDMPHLFSWEKANARLTRIALNLIGAHFASRI